ncbi:PAS domain S-box protein [Synechococcus sp. Nb3U1]|uniref:PAS domain S-box protein n=1 Tax=Synechococcus sp. Nb3U1 TaxID=1914529 RepID=UPI001F448D08|nr:PAS domain S-box protein [Synechococcus sp. Nb3U1]MCF2970262.1 PAS domain S-box protein [Synechococcus sp. Nb3U1]
MTPVPFEQFFEHCPRLLWAVDGAGRVLHMNKAWERYLGYSVQVLQKQPLLELLHPEDRPRIQAEWNKLWQGQGSSTLSLSGVQNTITFVGRLQIQDGLCHRFIWTASLLPLQEGEVIGLCGSADPELPSTGADPPTAQVLRDNHHHLQALIEQVSVGIGLTDLKGCVLSINPAAQRMHGYSQDELLQMNFADYTHPDDLQEDQELFQQLVAGEISSYCLEKRYLRKDGSQFWGRLTISLVRDPQGQPQFAVSVLEDISEAKQAEAALRQSEAEKQAIIQAIPDLMLWISAEGRYLSMVRQPVGFPVLANMDEIQGLSIPDIMPPDLAERELFYLREALRTGQQQIYTYPLILAGEERHFEVRMVPSGGEKVLAVVREFTDQKRAETALRNSEERLRAILENAPNAINILSLDGRILECNPAALHLLGYTLQELKALRFADYTYPEDQGLSEGILNELLTGHRESYRYEKRFVHKQGHVIWTRVAVSLLRDSTHTPTHIISIIEDITQAKRLDQERLVVLESLKESEARYRLLAENATDMISRHGPLGRFLDASPACLAILGYRPEELKGKLLFDMVHPEDLANLQAAFRPNLVSGVENEPRVIYRVRHQQGHFVWLETSSRLLIGPDGSLERVAVSRDITERKQAARDLERSLALLQATLEATTNGILVTDLQSHLLVHNRLLAQMWQLESFHLKPEAERTHHMAEQVQDPQAFLALVDELLAHPDTSHSAVLDLLDQRILHLVTKPLWIGGIITGRVWSFQDITNSKKIERMKNEFVSMVSHELRTPLTSIRGSLGLILGGVGGPLNEQLRHLLDIAQKNSERLLVLINDILDIEKIEAGRINFEIRPLFLRPLLEQILQVNQAYAESYGVQMRLQVDPDCEGCQIRADSHRLTQVVTNLLSNAIKFSPPGEWVDLRVIRIQGWLRLTVQDRGPGIPRSFRSQIFQRFAQADASDTRLRGGTGLGLSISKAIVDKLGGHIDFITCSAEEGDGETGTCFYLDFPLFLDGDPLAAKDAEKDFPFKGS